MSPQLGAGFNCLSEVRGLISYPVKTNVTITKGDALQDDTAGFAQLAIAGLTSTEFLGVAAEDVDNSGGGDGDKNVLIIPPREDYRFYVAVGSGALAVTDRGEIMDLNDKKTLAVDSPVATGWGLFITEIDTTNDYVYGYWRIAG